MRFHPKQSKRSTLTLKILSPIVVLTAIICYFNFDSVKRSIIDVNARSSYNTFLDTKFHFNEFFNGETSNTRKDLVVKMTPTNYVLLQKERAKKTKDYILNYVDENFKYNYFKAKVKFGDHKSKSDLKLFGLFPDHFGDSDGHSFRLKFNGKTGFGKKKVNVLKPMTRSFNLDRFSNILFAKSFKGLDITSQPINVIFNKSDYGIYLIEDFFDKYLIEKNFNRESYIFEITDKGLYFNHAPKDAKFLNQQKNLQNLALNTNSQAFLNLINEEKLYGFLALCLILNNSHQALGINLHWYYNPLTNTIEPTIRETKITKIDKVINSDEFYSSTTSLIGNRNKTLRNWLSSIKESDFNTKISNAILKIKNDLQSNLNDDNYLDFKQKLIGFNAEMIKNENTFKTNLEQLKLESNNEEITKTLETIHITKDTLISNDLIISKHQKLIVEKGTTISLTNNANLLVFDGGITINGTETYPINFTSEANSSSSIYIQTDQYVNVQHATFNNLSALKKDLWQLPSAVTLFESNATFLNCTFSTNKDGDDMVNTFRCDDVIFENCTFSNIKSDAIDTDFSNVSITHCNFDTIGNDAVDGSGSHVEIDNSIFKGIEDKAISAGEESKFTTKNNTITQSELALVCKDGSQLISTQDELKNNTLDLVLFTKKVFYSAPSLQLKDTKINSNLVEKDAIFSGLNTPVFTENINKKLYGNEFGKATN